MPDNEPTDDSGDGAGIDILVPSDGEDEMAADLPEAVANQLMVETVGNIQADNRRGRDGASLSTNVLHAVQVRNHDEVGVLEGRAVSGVNSTDLGRPSAP